MKKFLERISSRKFMALMAAEVGGAIALFTPAADDAAKWEAAALKIGGLIVMILAGLGYAAIEGGIDKARENGKAKK